MSHGECEVVVVAGQDGQPLRINKSDYDASPGDFTLLDAPEPAPAPAPEPAAITGTVMVGKDGTGAKARFYLTDEAGNRLEGENIDPKGYDTDALAWEAALALAPKA